MSLGFLCCIMFKPIIDINDNTGPSNPGQTLQKTLGKASFKKIVQEKTF